MELMSQILLLAVGFGLLIKGADWFVDGAAGVAARMGIPQLVIGLTIVAMGTSAPETAVSISSALKGNAGICIGNVVGSNILNVLIILGLTAVIARLPVAESTVRYEIPYMIFITLVLLAQGYTGGQIVLWEGAVLWGLFLLYLGYLYWMAKKNPVEQEETALQLPIWKLVSLILVGLVAIVLGSNLTVDAATTIAKAVGVSDRFIGLTIVALGTSLPELVTSVTAARKGNPDIAIGNIVGSNIYNILFVIGTSAFITPIPFASSFLVDTALAALVGVVLWAGVVKTRSLGRTLGVVMLAGYLAYFLYLV